MRICRYKVYNYVECVDSWYQSARKEDAVDSNQLYETDIHRLIYTFVFLCNFGFGINCFIANTGNCFVVLRLTLTNSTLQHKAFLQYT